MNPEIDRVVFSTLKRLILNALTVGTISSIVSVFFKSNPSEIVSFIVPFFWILVIVTALGLMGELIKYKQQWSSFIAKDGAEAIGYLLSISLFVALLANGAFILPLFSFPYIFHQLQPMEMRKEIFDFWGWQEFIITSISLACISLISFFYFNKKNQQ